MPHCSYRLYCILILFQNHLHYNSKIFLLLIISYMLFLSNIQTHGSISVQVKRVSARRSPRATNHCFSHSRVVFWRSGCLRWNWWILHHYGSSFTSNLILSKNGTATGYSTILGDINVEMRMKKSLKTVSNHRSLILNKNVVHKLVTFGSPMLLKWRWIQSEMTVHLPLYPQLTQSSSCLKFIRFPSVTL